MRVYGGVFIGGGKVDGSGYIVKIRGNVCEIQGRGQIDVATFRYLHYLRYFVVILLFDKLN